MPCLTCVFHIVVGTDLECHFAPPVPSGEFSFCRSDWPIVAATDQCSNFSAGTHGGMVCGANCANYHALPATDPGACCNPSAPMLCADGLCVAVPPTPVGEYRGDNSLWTRVRYTDRVCGTCFSGGGP